MDDMSLGTPASEECLLDLFRRCLVLAEAEAEYPG